MRTELAAAHAAVDEAVAILRDGRARPHQRITKAAKDFLTEVLGAGQDVRITGLPRDAAAVLSVMCLGLSRPALP